MNILEGWTPPTRPAKPRSAGKTVARLELRGEIGGAMAVLLFKAIDDARDDSIEIEINSTGGSAVCAFGIFEKLITHPHHVTANIVGRASSGGAIAAMGADHRRIAAGATVLLHRTTAVLNWRMRGDELRDWADRVDQSDAAALSIFTAATGRRSDVVDCWERDAKTFTAAEAVAAGLAHEIIT